MSPEKILELLQLFVSEDPDKLWMHEIFSFMGMTWATNGVVCVRANGVLVQTKIHELSLVCNKAAKLFNNQQITYNYQAIPEIIMPSDPPKKDCLECGGTGSLDFCTKFNEYFEICKTCEGEGKVDSWKNIYHTDYARTIIPKTGVTANAVLLERLSKLPGVKIQAELAVGVGFRLLPLFLKWECGDAILMPAELAA